MAVTKENVFPPVSNYNDNNLSLFLGGGDISTSLKNDCTLFSRLYIACQTRDGDLKEFFKHENQSYPPSLSVHGSLRLGKKSDLLGCLEDLAETSVEAETDTIILDGAGTAKTFDDYAFIPYIQGQLQRPNRVDNLLCGARILKTVLSTHTEAARRRYQEKGSRLGCNANKVAAVSVSE